MCQSVRQIKGIVSETEPAEGHRQLSRFGAFLSDQLGGRVDRHELEAALGISRSTLYRVLRGEAALSLRQQEQLAEVLGVPIGDLNRLYVASSLLHENEDASLEMIEDWEQTAERAHTRLLVHLGDLDYPLEQSPVDDADLDTGELVYSEKGAVVSALLPYVLEEERQRMVRAVQAVREGAKAEFADILDDYLIVGAALSAVAASLADNAIHPPQGVLLKLLRSVAADMWGTTRRHRLIKAPVATLPGSGDHDAGAIDKELEPTSKAAGFLAESKTLSDEELRIEVSLEELKGGLIRVVRNALEPLLARVISDQGERDRRLDEVVGKFASTVGGIRTRDTLVRYMHQVTAFLTTKMEHKFKRDGTLAFLRPPEPPSEGTALTTLAERGIELPEVARVWIYEFMAELARKGLSDGEIRLLVETLLDKSSMKAWSAIQFSGGPEDDQFRGVWLHALHGYLEMFLANWESLSPGALVSALPEVLTKLIRENSAQSHKKLKLSLANAG
jgi:transcriptional regulator with XRE-family HTH domain